MSWLQTTQNCGQTAADRDTVTIDSLWELVIALSNSIIADFYDVLFNNITERLGLA